MNAPFLSTSERVRCADLTQPDEVARIEGLVAEFGTGGGNATGANIPASIFHRPAWLRAIAAGTGQKAHGLLTERGGSITGWLPLTEVHSPIFGRALVSSGFAVGGGILAERAGTIALLSWAAQEHAQRLSCSTVELRGGLVAGGGWRLRSDSHCSFAADLAADDAAQLAAIPRKQRAEVRKGLKAELEVRIGCGEADRRAHYAVYCESVHNLGTPVFPRSLFDAVLDSLPSDILSVLYRGEPVASVLSLYHGGSVMPYWGGGTRAARNLRANDRMYFELMRHARTRGCTRFDFGRSKTGSGPFLYKRTWGFEPQPLTYATWTAPGAPERDANPASDRHQGRIALWKKLPLPVANRLGPLIARGLG